MAAHPQTDVLADFPLLPSVETFQQVANFDNGWSDHYGALHVAAKYAGIELPERYSLQGIWMHGCGCPWLAELPHLLYANSPKATLWPVLVSRRDEKDRLRQHGVAEVEAVGLPIVYTPDPNLSRQTNSLLVMPAHTLTGDAHHDHAAFERYADEIVGVAGGFDRVIACIHPNCIQNGLWVREFTSRGIEIISGAQTNDRNALLRMRSLFSQFETMTTNGWGGHIAYALAFGARVAIYGAEPKRAEADFLRDSTWSSSKESLKVMLAEKTKTRLRAFLKDYYREPRNAVSDIETGRWLIGWDNRLSPAAMKELLHRIVPAMRESDAAREARVKRQATRKHAAQLVRGGRKSDAIALLLHFLQAAAETKNPQYILETLEELSADLRTLDAQRASLLNEQARRLAARLKAAGQAAA